MQEELLLVEDLFCLLCQDTTMWRKQACAISYDHLHDTIVMIAYMAPHIEIYSLLESILQLMKLAPLIDLQVSVPLMKVSQEQIFHALMPIHHLLNMPPLSVMNVSSTCLEA